MAVKARIKKAVKVIAETITETPPEAAAAPETPPAAEEPILEYPPVIEMPKPKEKPVKKELPPTPVIDLTALTVEQPMRDAKGKLSKADQARLHPCIYFKHLDNGGKPVLEYLVPDKNQRPYLYQDFCKWWGIYHAINTNRVPMYLMQEVKMPDGSYLPAVYEPDPLSPMDVSPSKHFEDIDWPFWRRYLLHRDSGWQDVIRTGIIVVGITVVIIFGWMSWTSYQRMLRTPPVVENSTSIIVPTPTIGVK